MTYEFMNELDYQCNKIDITNKVSKGRYPIIYYIKDVKYRGMDINLFFKLKNNDSNNTNFTIRGGVIDFNDFKKIKDEKDVENYLQSSFYGKYESVINTGIIVFDKEFSEGNQTNKKGDDDYSFILIYQKPPS